METVLYDDEHPWPVSADEFGDSLERIDPLADDTTVANWRASQALFREIPPIVEFLGKIVLDSSELARQSYRDFLDLVSDDPELRAEAMRRLGDLELEATEAEQLARNVDALDTRGFDNAVVLDGIGNVAELATANIWYAKDGAAHTPVANGTFLNGITKQRVVQLLRDAGVTVYERAITVEELMDADEIFTSGNYGKVMPITRIEDRDLQPGPVYSQARKSYWDWAHGS